MNFMRQLPFSCHLSAFSFSHNRSFSCKRVVFIFSTRNMKIPIHLFRPLVFAGISFSAHSFIHRPSFNRPLSVQPFSTKSAWQSVLSMSSATASSAIPAWGDLAEQSAATPIGKALNDEVSLRKEGKGSAARENTLRKFGRDGEPVVTLYRYVFILILCKNACASHHLMLF